MIAVITLQSLAGATTMASITIRNLDERTKRELRLQAARKGRSMEEEARSILRSSLGQREEAAPHLIDVARAIVKRTGGFEVELPPREIGREPPKFD